MIREGSVENLKYSSQGDSFCFSRNKNPWNIPNLLRFALGILGVNAGVVLVSGLDCGSFGKIGVHELGKSPVYGSRNWEVLKIEDSPFIPLFEKFGEGLYRNTSFRELFKEEELEKCNPLADQIFNDYIGKYDPYNCTSENIIEENVLGISRMRKISAQEIRIQTSPVNETFLYGLAKIHEVMHGEEMPYHVDGISELFTSLRQHILTDEVFKECYGKPADFEVDYGKTLSIKERIFSAGELANFYRDLEKTQGSLSSALLSTESIAYLMGAPQYQYALEIVRKYPGSKWAIKIAKKSLSDTNPQVRFIAAVVTRDLLERKQYLQAFQIAKVGLKDSDLDLRKIFIGVVNAFMEQGQYGLAFDLVIDGLGDTELEIQVVASLALERLMEREENLGLAFQTIIEAFSKLSDPDLRARCACLATFFVDLERWDQALEIARTGLEDADDSVRHEAIKIALRFIEKEQYEPAFQLIIKNLESSDPDFFISQVGIKELIQKNYKIQEFFLFALRQDIPLERRSMVLALLPRS